MTPSDLKSIRNALGLSAERFARFVGLTGYESARTVRHWERGDRAIPGPVVRLLECATTFPAVREWLTRRIDGD